MRAVEKVRCSECGWAGLSTEVDRVEDPRPLEGQEPDVWSVCPACRAPENLAICCEAEGCWHEATCGTPNVHGARYLWTCSEHWPQRGLFTIHDRRLTAAREPGAMPT